MNATFTALLLARILRPRISLFLFSLAPVKPAPDDRLEQHMVGGPRHANPNSEVDLPFRRNVQVERRNELLRLIGEGIESRDRAETTVILQPEGHGFGEVP